MISIHSISTIGWQKEFVRIFQNLEDNDKLIIKASRQKGKSTILCQAMLFYALNNSKSEGYFISPTNNQCRKQFNDLKKGIEKSGVLKKMNETTQEFEFVNGSKIYFRSSEAGNNLRGNTVKKSALFIDEAAFIKDDTITSVLLPYVTVNKCPVIMSSTPRKKRGVFYEYYQKAVSGERGYKYIDVNDFDNSFFITAEQIEDYRKVMSGEKFKNEVLGLFSSDSEGVFGDFSSHLLSPSDKEAYYAGIDWSAKGNDSTVIVYFNKNREMCKIFREKGNGDLTERLHKIAADLNSNINLKKIEVETNSIGAVYLDMLKKEYCGRANIVAFNTTNDSKREIIEKMIAALGKGEITLLPDGELEYQFSIFESTLTPSGKITYKANENVQESHDDIVMATAFAVDTCMNTNKGKYIIRGK